MVTLSISQSHFLFACNFFLICGVWREVLPWIKWKRLHSLMSFLALQHFTFCAAARSHDQSLRVFESLVTWSHLSWTKAVAFVLFRKLMKLKQGSPIIFAVPSPRGSLMGLVVPNKAPSSPNWNSKHYKSVSFCLVLDCQASLHKPKDPLLKTALRRFWIFVWGPYKL